MYFKYRNHFQKCYMHVSAMRKGGGLHYNKAFTKGILLHSLPIKEYLVKLSFDLFVKYNTELNRERERERERERVCENRPSI